MEDKALVENSGMALPPARAWRIWNIFGTFLNGYKVHLPVLRFKDGALPWKEKSDNSKFFLNIKAAKNLVGDWGLTTRRETVKMKYLAQFPQTMKPLNKIKAQYAKVFTKKDWNIQKNVADCISERARCWERAHWFWKNNISFSSRNIQKDFTWGIGTGY